MAAPPHHVEDDRSEVLVVGAGPTGLALAAQLSAFDVPCRIIDRAGDRAHESRALAVQPRTLEVLRPFGVADELVRRGNPVVQLRLHVGSRVTRSPLFDLGWPTPPIPSCCSCPRPVPKQRSSSTSPPGASPSSAARPSSTFATAPTG